MKPTPPEGGTPHSEDPVLPTSSSWKHQYPSSFQEINGVTGSEPSAQKVSWPAEDVTFDLRAT
jgi:hypothetical protein